MNADTNKPDNVDMYINGFSTNIQKLLKQLRAIIVKAAPEAEEVLSYHMPAYKYHGTLLYIAAHTHHIGFYPMPSAIKFFKEELSVYKTAKGSVQFPLDKPLPVKLITRIVIFRMKENLVKAEMKIKPRRKIIG